MKTSSSAGPRSAGMERATERAYKAIDWLVSHGVIPTREAISVAMAYFDGVREVCQDLEARSRGGEEISPGVVTQVYERYLSPQSADSVNKLQEGLKTLLQDVEGSVNEASATAQKQGDALQDSIAKIDGGQGAEALRVVAMAVLEVAREAQQSNQRMHENLQRSHQEMTRLREEIEFHKQESEVDPLTRLMNRRGLDVFLRGQAEEVASDFAVLMIDMDQFKEVNDTYGHAVGDAVLRNVSAAIQKCLLGYDRVARYGGDEFLAVLPGASTRDVMAVAEQIRRVIEVLRLKRRSDGLVIKAVTASIGVAVQAPGESFEEVILRADDAAYTSKTTGRNRLTKSDKAAAVSAMVDSPVSDLVAEASNS